MEFSVQYGPLRDREIELTKSGKQRSDFTQADCVITQYQLEKLKFLASSLILKGEARDAEGVISIYQRIKMSPKYRMDNGAAAEVLNCMLDIVSNHGPRLGDLDNPKSRNDIVLDPSFQW